MSARRGSFFSTMRWENSGGMVSTPLIRPLRRSVSAWPESVYSMVSNVFAFAAIAMHNSRSFTAGTR